MIPGTGKQVAAVALASLNWDGAKMHQVARDARRLLKLAERRELRARGKLPGSSALPHPVKLGIDMVEVVLPRMRSKREQRQALPSVSLSPATLHVVARTTVGRSQLWFDATGEAWLSFEDPMDADLFVLALDGDRC